MYTKEELTKTALVSLIEIAQGLGISRASKLTENELIYKILDHQAANPDPEDENKPKVSPRPKRARLKPKPIAESNMAPGTHRAKQAKEKAPEKKLFADVDPEPSSKIDINDVLLPEVPQIPEVKTPNTRLILRHPDITDLPDDIILSEGVMDEIDMNLIERKVVEPDKFDAEPETAENPVAEAEQNAPQTIEEALSLPAHSKRKERTNKKNNKNNDKTTVEQGAAETRTIPEVIVPASLKTIKRPIVRKKWINPPTMFPRKNMQRAMPKKNKKRKILFSR